MAHKKPLTAFARRYYCIFMFFLLAYCLIVASFVSWSSRTKSSLSFNCSFVKSFEVLYFAVLVRVKQVVVKVQLKYTTSHRTEILYPIFYHPYIYKIMQFELVARSLNKMKEICSCVT